MKIVRNVDGGSNAHAIVMSLSALHRKPRPQFRANRRRPSCPGIHRTPDRQCLRENAAVARANKFGMAFEADAARCSDPCSGDDPVSEHGRPLVIDLVPHHHPEQLCLIRGGGVGGPMRNGGVLHPAHVGNVVHVPELIDIGWLHGDGQLEDFRELAHELPVSRRKST